MRASTVLLVSGISFAMLFVLLAMTEVTNAAFARNRIILLNNQTLNATDLWNGCRDPDRTMDGPWLGIPSTHIWGVTIRGTATGNNGTFTDYCEKNGETLIEYACQSRSCRFLPGGTLQETSAVRPGMLFLFASSVTAGMVAASTGAQDTGIGFAWVPKADL